MKSYNILLLLILLTSTQLYAHKSTYPIYIKLIFDKEAKPDSYLWDRKVLPDSTSWAKQSYDGKNWELITELPRKVKVGIALAGGGIKGIAHIGVLRALEENNIPIHAIAGTSMGAIIGGIYACGYYIDTLEWIVTNDIDWNAIFSDQPPRQYLPLWERLRGKPREPGVDINIYWKKPFISLDLGTGLRTAQKYTDELVKRTLEYDYRYGFNFNNLPIPFGAILTDMMTGKSKLLREGTVSTAGRASGSLPIVFEPMNIGGVPYVDGGVLDDLPVDAFIRFDSSRAPDNMMNIIGEDTINYVIAVYPLKMRGIRDVIKEMPSLSGPLGISVMSRTLNLARDYHVWNSWDAAHGKIDIDVEGWFDFSPEKLKDMYRAGYSATWREINNIKKEIAALEARLRHSEQPQQTHLISTIKILSIIKDDTTHLKERKEIERIEKAIRLKEGCYVEKIDICDVLKRIYNLGEFEDIIAKIDNANEDWVITFILKKKKSYLDSLKVILKAGPISLCDSLVEKVVKEVVKKKERALNFSEIKEIVEISFVKQGFVSPHLDSIKFCSSIESADTLLIYARQGTYINGVKISCRDIRMKKALEKEFNKPFSPGKVLEKASYIHKEFCLKTIAVEGLKGDSLIIAVERKSTHTLEFPYITLATYEGINLFGELRNRRWFTWSPYFSYVYNFPAKYSHDLPQGHKFIMGLQRTRSISLIPDINAYWTRLRFLSNQATMAFDKEFVEIGSELNLPIYLNNLAFIPGFEFKLIEKGMNREIPDINEDKVWLGHFNGIFGIKFDNLDRIIFPESGWKLDFDTKVGKENNSWWNRARVRVIGAPLRYRIQNRVTMTLTTKFFGSYYSKETPDHELYSLGGFTPVGSYQIDVLDSEDFPGYKRYEITEQLMWKTVGSLRLALMERSLLGLKFNIHLEGSVYFADAIPRGGPFFSKDRQLLVSPEAGIYFDTSYFNAGLTIRQTYRKGDPRSISRFYHNVHISIVYYGFGF